MARIPEAQRRTFASGIIRPDLQAIGRAQAPFQQTARTADAIGNILAQKREQQLVAESAEFNSRLNIQMAEQFNSATRSQRLQQNPTLARGEVNRIINDLKQSPEFTQKPQLVQAAANRSLSRLRESFINKAINFENRQTFQNVAIALDKTQSNFEVQALDTDTNINDLLRRYTATVTASTKSGALTLNQAERQVTEGAKSIVLNRAQRLINENDLEGAKAFIADDSIKEHLGADGLQRVTDTIERKERLAANQVAKLNSLRRTNPWKFIANVDSEEIPPIDISSPETLATRIDDRIAFVGRKNQEFGINLPVLTELEETQFVDITNRLGSEQGANLLNQITADLPDNQQDLIAAQLFEKDNSLGVAVAVADEDVALAESLLNGRRVLDKKLVDMPASDRFVRTVNSVIGEAIQIPSLRQAALKATETLYADNIFKNNINRIGVSRNIVNDSIQRLFGPVIEINGGEVFGFRKADGQFIDDDDFEDFFEDLTEAQLVNGLGDVPRVADGRPLDLVDIKDDAVLIMIGNGQYAIQLFDEFAVNQDGSVYNLNMKKLFDESRMN